MLKQFSVENAEEKSRELLKKFSKKFSNSLTLLKNDNSTEKNKKKKHIAIEISEKKSFEGAKVVSKKLLRTISNRLPKNVWRIVMKNADGIPK